MPQSFADGNDDDVVRLVLAGDVNAFEHLVARYEAYVFSIVRKHAPAEEVEALAHEAFVRAYRSLPKYKQQNGFSNWLCGICVRTCADFWRKHYRRREMPVSALSDDHRQWLEKVLAGEAGRDFEAMGRQQEAREILNTALNRMTPQERMVLGLVHLEGHSIKAAAKLMGCSAANVKIRAFRARKKLKKLLAGQEEKIIP
ncbi:MAG: RNA polymerase sigma factor [Thermodesulfobacteriota bacterium]